MFLDVKDSTSLAERLGNLKFSALIQMFFRDLGEPLAEFKGQVSHYIGDEAVIFWTPTSGLSNGNCVQFLLDLQQQISDRAADYERELGIAPAFKAGLHIGTVVVAEVHGGKSEIVLHGDAVNTTARIVGLCSVLECDLLVSADLVRRFGSSGRHAFVSMGQHPLRGKATPIELFRL